MSRAERGPVGLYHRTVVYILFLILLAPLLGTFVYSIATSWSASILPSGFTYKWYVALWSDPRFLIAFGQSLLVCVGALILSVVLILPLLFVVHYHFPKLDALMNILILLPFAVPPVVSSVVTIRVFSSGNFLSPAVTKRAMNASNPGVWCGSAFFSAARISTSAVASTSTHTVASGISDRLRLMFAATALRTPRTGVRPEMPSPVRASVPPAAGTACPGVSAGCCTAGCAAGAGLMTASTSRRMISPLAPEPWSSPKSTPWSRAIRRTSGEITAPNFPGTRVRISTRSSAAFSASDSWAEGPPTAAPTEPFRARVRRATPCPPGVP